MKLTSRAGLTAGLLVGAIALAACSSSKSGGDTNSSSTPAAGSTSTSTSTATGTAADISCATGSLSSDGSSAQANAMTTWATDYNKKCSGAKVNYTSTNSGQGVADFLAGKIGFGGSDAALNPAAQEPSKAAAACGSPAWDIPMVTGPIAIGYNIKGVSDLTLNSAVLTKIFLGTITKWNDPAIAALNSGASLPSEPIKVFFRSDPSGTSKNFEKYLSTTSPSVWGNLTVDKPWPGHAGAGEAGSPAVASAVKSTEGGIGYMEWSYAGNNGLSTAKIDNGAGAVALSAQTAGAFVAGAKITGTGGDLTLNIDYTAKTPNAYPIVLVTYEVVCSKYKDASTGSLVKSFLTYTSSQAGQGLLPAQGYAPLPSSILTQVQAAVAKIS